MSGLNLYSRLYVYLPPRTRDKVYSRPRAGKGKVTLERGKTDGILLHYTFKAHMRKREKMITGHPPSECWKGAGAKRRWVSSSADTRRNGFLPEKLTKI